MHTVQVRRWARIALSVTVMLVNTALLAVLAPSAQAAGPLLTIGVNVSSATATQATYTITVANQGSSPATSITVTNKVPSNTTFIESSPAPNPAIATPSPSPTGTGSSTGCVNGGQAEPAGTTCAWSLGDLAVGGAPKVITVKLGLLDAASYGVVNTAEVSCCNASEKRSDTDSSLRREKIVTGDDTFRWDRTPVPSVTWHGACPELHVDSNRRAFIDLESTAAAPLPAESSIDRFFAAELSLKWTSGAGTLGAHRITSAEWAEDTGDCENVGSPTGPAPTSAETATGTATPPTTAGTRITFDVKADLDAKEDRSSYNGWELKKSTEPATTTKFHSTEAAEADRPALVLVYTQPEAARCIDADPESATSGPTEEHPITAFVTDGGRVTNSAGDDGCTGGPIGGASVSWTITDDDLDIYISLSGGTPTTKTGGGDGDAGPDSTTTTTGSDGFTAIRIKLDQPSVAGRNIGENRIAASIGGGGPGVTPSPGTSPSPGASPSPGPALFDEVTKVWVGPTPTATASASASPMVTPTVSPTPTPTPTPGTVDDLRARPRTGRVIILKFSATGSDGESPPAARSYVIKKSRKPITDASFEAAKSLCGGECTFSPDAVGDELKKRVRGLRPKKRYFFALKARNEAGGTGEMSNVVAARTKADRIAPAKVRNLRAKAVSRTKIRLRWFAPGDDRMDPPPAKRYLVKQASKPIRKERAFRRALALCGGVCKFQVKKVGDRVVLNITDLRPNTRYCYALKARDAAGNKSPTSNSSCVRTR